MNTPNRLALLLAAPQPGETAMLVDQAAMTAALLARGVPADHILALQGQLDRPRVIAFPAVNVLGSFAPSEWALVFTASNFVKCRGRLPNRF